MLVKKLRFRKWLALSVPLCFATYVGAQSTPAQNPSSNNDNGRGDIASFDQFLDSHHEIAEQLRKQPSLADNKQFLKDHPALQSYLQQNPSVRERLEQNPNAFMSQEAHWEHSGDDRAQDRNAGYDRDRNNNYAYDRDRGNANGNNSSNAGGNRSANANSTNNNDNGRGDVASFDGFLDSHREIAEQLRKQPSLADNKQFLKDHPALQSYLQQNPSVRERLEQNPNAFMSQEAYWEHSGDDRTQDRNDRNNNYAYNRDRNNDNNYDRDRGNGAAEHDRDMTDRDRDAHQHFGAFLGSHQDIAAQLSRKPSLCNDHDYLQNHPELQAYLNAHPEVRQPLTSDPDTFMKSTQQFNSNGQSGQTGKMPAPTATQPGTTTQPKPYKQ
jgi:hypothetical protein